MNAERWIMKKSRISIIILSASVVIILLAAFLLPGLSRSSGMQDKGGLADSLANVQDRFIIIDKEEFDFYYGLAERDFQDRTLKEQIEQAALNLAAESYAQFRMGETLGLCQAYSFSSMQRSMEADNQSRQVKMSQGEVVYGMQEFTLPTYFSYIRNGLRQDIVSKLSESADTAIEKAARKYYRDNPDSFRTLTKVQYETDETGVMEKRIFLREDMSTLEKTDDELFRFLYNGKEGESLQYEKNDQLISVNLLKKEETQLSWEDDAASIIYSYVDQHLYEELLNDAKKHSLVSYE